MKRIILVLASAGALAACTPADEQYCTSYERQGTSEYGACIDYYHNQEAAFNQDRMFCDAKADETYPPTLYDRGRYQHVPGGFMPYGGYHGPHGGFYSGTTVFLEPDYRVNAEVDRLRMNIIDPCMQARGWNSGASWQAGRHTTVRKTRNSKTPKRLPWQQ